MKVKRRESSERGRSSFLSVFDGNKKKNRALSPQTKTSDEICKHQGNFGVFSSLPLPKRTSDLEEWSSMHEKRRDAGKKEGYMRSLQG